MWVDALYREAFYLTKQSIFWYTEDRLCISFNLIPVNSCIIQLLAAFRKAPLTTVTAPLTTVTSRAEVNELFSVSSRD